MTEAYQSIHPDFRFNGKSYSKDEMLCLADDFLNKTNPYEQSIGSFITDWFHDSPTISINTSGSTGSPKRLTIQKKAMLSSAYATGQYFQLQPGMTALLCLPANFVGGKMMLVRAWALGLQLSTTKPSQNPLQNHRKSFDFCAMTPHQLSNSIANLSLIKTLIVGGAPVPDSLLKKIQSCETQIFETYGMTETVSHIALKKLNGTDNDNCFKTLPEVTVSQDHRGCLVVHAPTIISESITTNDLIHLHTPKTFEWLGRSDRVINSGGIKLIPEQIEKALSPLFTQRFFVAGIPDSTYGEKLILIVEGASEHSIEELKKSSSLASLQLPKSIFTIPKFQETQSGKIDRLATLETL